MPERSRSEHGGINRRQFLRAGALTGLASFAAARGALSAAESLMLPFTNGERALVKFPQKRPLILLTTRPPQLETPFSVFNEGLLTPNDAFFVRYHLSQVPTSIDPEQFSLEIKGRVNAPLKLSLNDLRKSFESVEIVAVN